MKIIPASVEIMTPIDGQAVLKHLEQCGRVCYKSEGKIAEGSAEKFLANIVKRGHEAVLEHYSFTVKFICDRGVSLKTEVVMTANIREWRHFLKLRTSPAAHPQIREVATPLLKELQELVPILFDDIGGATE